MKKERKITSMYKFLIYYRGPLPDDKDIESIYAKDEEEARDFFVKEFPKCTIRMVEKIDELA